MKTILVSLDNLSYWQAVLETALILGRSFESYIEGFARGPDLHNLIAVEVPLAVPLSDEVPQQQVVENAHQRFETFMRAHAVPEALREPNGFSFGWFGNALQDPPFLGDYGRAFDIAVVGRPGSDSDGPRMASLEEALFESGRPVLLAPPIAPKEMGQSIVIAWNGSTETARAV